MWPRHRAILQHLCTFDRNWSKRCDRVAIDKQIVLNFLGKGYQCRLVGGGSSTLVQKIRTLSPSY
jgi:hypothetical protein